MLAESVVATAGCVWSPLQLTKASRSNVEASRLALTEILFNRSIGWAEREIISDARAAERNRHRHGFDRRGSLRLGLRLFRRRRRGLRVLGGERRGKEEAGKAGGESEQTRP